MVVTPEVTACFSILLDDFSFGTIFQLCVLGDSWSREDVCLGKGCGTSTPKDVALVAGCRASSLLPLGWLWGGLWGCDGGQSCSQGMLFHSRLVLSGFSSILNEVDVCWPASMLTAEPWS